MSIKSKSTLFIIIFFGFFLNVRAAEQINSAIQVKSVENDTEIQDNSQDQAQETIVKDVVVGEDELPTESVTPITDNNSAVLNKKIKFTKRFLVDFDMGSVLDEPIVNASYYLVRASYYTNEEYSFGFGIRSRFGGRTSYSEQLYQGSAQLEFNRAPAPTQSTFLSYGYNFYYGKISIAKNLVVPASTKLESDFGLQTFGSSSKPFVQAAINQSFFLTSNLALGLNLGLSMAQIVDPTSVNIRSSQPLPSEASFANKIQFNQYLSVNLNVLL